MKRVLSGMRPTGNLHLGNYLGAIRQFLELQKLSGDCFFFIADIHALTEILIKGTFDDIDALSIEVAKYYIACGVDPKLCHIYRQSDIPEISEINTLLANVAALGLLRRCTTYKERIIKLNRKEGELSLGLLGYPVLMAADILGVRAQSVPVGKDQKQHVEMARQIAMRFNNMFGPVFTIPQMNLKDAIRVPGIDGAEKMGKSDGNTISLLDPPEMVIKKVKSIPTQSETSAELTPGTHALFALTEMCCDPDVYADFHRKLLSGEGRFFGAMKEKLADDINRLLEPIQANYNSLSDDDVRAVLQAGATVARPVAKGVLTQMREAMRLSKPIEPNEVRGNIA